MTTDYRRPGSASEITAPRPAKPIAHQNDVWNATAASAVEEAPAAAPARITTSTLAPNEPPTCVAIVAFQLL